MLNFDFPTVFGAVAATCTTASYFPQLKKCWDTGSAEDLSLKMLMILAFGIGCWVVYGALKSDWMIIIANAISLVCLSALIGFKLKHG